MPSRRPTLRLDLPILHPNRIGGALALNLGLAIALTAPGAAQSPAAEGLEIVVTTAVLGSVVADLVGDQASVTVLMGSGVDPHDWAPSAQDIETLYAADLVVANGRDLEEGLHDALDEAAANGVRVFEATDHITLRDLDEGAASPAPDDEHAGLDPHFWVDPVAMRQVVDALAPVVGELGADVTVRQADLDGRLDALDAEVRATVEAIPEASRRLVTGHGSMGYYSDRYGFQLVGAIVPGLSSQGEVSAQELAAISALIRDSGVGVIFTEIGTPQSVVDAIAAETGASVVALPSHTLPSDGSYLTFIRDITSTIAGALS